MLVVPAASPYQSLNALVTAAKARPGTLAYASSGNGSGAHLAMAAFAKEAGIDVVHVPYRGGGPAMTDLVAGNVAMAFASAAAATAQRCRYLQLQPNVPPQMPLRRRLIS